MGALACFDGIFAFDGIACNPEKIQTNTREFEMHTLHACTTRTHTCTTCNMHTDTHAHATCMHNTQHAYMCGMQHACTTCMQHMQHAYMCRMRNACKQIAVLESCFSVLVSRHDGEEESC